MLIAAALTMAGCGDDAQGQRTVCGMDGGCVGDLDASAVTLDAASSAAEEGDASAQYRCGSWKAARFDDVGPPADAQPYGFELTPTHTNNEYVCRFRDMLDGRPVVLQGRALFGYSCYAVLPVATATPAQVEPSETFEVLVGSKDCARMVPYDPSLHLLPTGLDVDGNPTFSCRAAVPASGTPGVSMPLGRYDPARRSCVFEWYRNVREAPRLEGEQFEVLAVQ